MKDATGELSMTAIAVVAIAAVGVVFTTLIWPSIKSNIVRSSQCTQAFNCEADTDKDGMVTCSYCKNDACANNANGRGEVQCPVE